MGPNPIRKCVITGPTNYYRFLFASLQSSRPTDLRTGHEGGGGRTNWWEISSPNGCSEQWWWCGGGVDSPGKNTWADKGGRQREHRKCEFRVCFPTITEWAVVVVVSKGISFRLPKSLDFIQEIATQKSQRLAVRLTAKVWEVSTFDVCVVE